MLAPDIFRREVARLSLALDAGPTQQLPPDDRLAQLYEDVKHLDDITFVMACDRCRKELDWFPKAKQILERAREISRGLGHEQTAIDAWGEFRKKITLRLNLDLLSQSPEDEARRVGLTPAEMQIARRLGGFAHLMQMSPRDLDFKAKEFQAVYEDVAARSRAEDALVAIEPGKPSRMMLGEG